MPVRYKMMWQSQCRKEVGRINHCFHGARKVATREKRRPELNDMPSLNTYVVYRNAAKVVFWKGAYSKVE